MCVCACRDSGASNSICPDWVALMLVITWVNQHAVELVSPLLIATDKLVYICVCVSACVRERLSNGAGSLVSLGRHTYTRANTQIKCAQRTVASDWPYPTLKELVKSVMRISWRESNWCLTLQSVLSNATNKKYYILIHSIFMAWRYILIMKN